MWNNKIYHIWMKFTIIEINILYIFSFRYQASVLILTYFTYMTYHLTRKPISVVKSVLHQNCSTLVPPPGIRPGDDQWCNWAPFSKYLLFLHLYFFFYFHNPVGWQFNMTGKKSGRLVCEFNIGKSICFLMSHITLPDIYLFILFWELML